MVSFRLRRPSEDVARLIIGHEALGQVLETGSAVANLSVETG